jgi:hypothetical protein
MLLRPLHPGDCPQAIRTRDRWQARQVLLAEAEGTADRGGTIY